MARIKSYYTTDEIVTGLYTLGGEYMTIDNTEYIGPYHRYTTTNEVYTQAAWNIRESVALIKLQDLPVTVKQYRNIKPLYINQNSPQAATVTIAKQNFAAGHVTRYFCKKRNEDLVFETDATQYQKWIDSQIDRNLWDIVAVQWRITGPIEDSVTQGITIPGVANTNKMTVASIQPVMPTITQYFNNYTEYYTDNTFVTAKDINGLDS